MRGPRCGGIWRYLLACGAAAAVEQRRVYSIYYSGTLVLPYRRGVRVELGGWFESASCGSRTRDVILSCRST